MGKEIENTLYRNIMAAFLILIMHVLLIGGIGLLIIFFYGIMNHMVWMVLGTTCLTLGGYWFYRRIKSDGRVLKNMAGDNLKGKIVEISFLKGVATFKISDSQVNQSIDNDSLNRCKQLPAPDFENIQNLAELARLYEKKLITFDEYNKVKQKILQQ